MSLASRLYRAYRSHNGVSYEELSQITDNSLIMKRIFEHRSDLVRPKKALGQHFLTDLSVAQKIADALVVDGVGGAVPESGTVTVGNIAAAMPVLEIGPGMGVLSQYLLERKDIDLRMIEIDRESVDYLLTHFPKASGRVIEGDFLKMNLSYFFPPQASSSSNRHGNILSRDHDNLPAENNENDGATGTFAVIGNVPYNISSQIFFRIIDHKDSIPQVVCMIQKEVAERIAEQPGSKTYGILSVLLQAWYDIEYLFTVGEGAFNPPPKVKSAVIRLRRNSRTELGCDEKLFKTIVKTGFNQRRKTLRNSLKPLIADKAAREVWTPEQSAEFLSNPVFELRPERLSVEDFIALTKLFS